MTVAITGDVTALGASYVTVVVVVELSEPAPVAGLRLHVTPALDVSFETAAAI